MAEELQIAGTPARAKLRNPLGVIGLTLITLGIYYFFWYYKVNREMKDIGEARGTEECGTSPGTSLLAITLGAFVIIPPFVSHYKAANRLQATERVTGAPQGMEPGLLFVIWIFLSPVALYIFQANLNKAIKKQAGVEDPALPPALPPLSGQEAAAAAPVPAEAAPEPVPPPGDASAPPER